MTSLGSNYFRRDVQGLRAVAVVAVFLFHLYPDRYANGYLGVDVFIVISGFVISSLIFREVRTTNSLNIYSFLQRRVRRLLPVLLLVLASTSLAWLVFAPVDTHRNVIGTAISAVFVGANVFLYLKSIDYFMDSDSPMLHLWSLSMEEQFYFGLIVVGAALVALRRSGYAWVHWATRAKSLLSICLVSLGVSVLLRSSLNLDRQALDSLLFYFPFGRAWQFLAGTAVAAVSDLGEFSTRTSPRFRRVLFEMAVLGLLFVLLVGESDTQNFFSWTRITATFLTATALLLNCEAPSMGVVGQNPFVFLGDRSYSIFLWHLPLIELWYWMTGDRINLVNAIAVTLIASEISYRFVEQPFRMRVRLRKLHWHLLLASSVALFGAAITVGNSTIPIFIAERQTDGLPLPDLRDRWATFASRIPRDECEDRLFVYECGELSSETDVVLVGDSHALAISHTFLDVARRLNLQPYVYAAPSCQFLTSPVLTGREEAEFNQCEQLMREIYRILIQRDLILVVSECPRLRNSDCPDERLTATDQSSFNSRLEVSNVRQENLRGLVGAGSKVVLVQDLPIIVDEIRKKQSLFGSLFAESDGIIQPLNERFVISHNFFRNDEKILTSKFPDSVRLYDPSRYLCGKFGCLGLTPEALPVWSNEDHITVNGADLLQDSMLTAIADVFRKP